MTQQTPPVLPWPQYVFGPTGSELTVETVDGDEFEGTHEHLICEGATAGWLVVKYLDVDGEESTERHISIPLDRIKYCDWTAPAAEPEPEKPEAPALEGGEDVVVAALPMHVGTRIRFAVGTADGEEVVDGTLIGIGRSPHPQHQRVVVAREEGADRAYNLPDSLTVRIG